MKTKDNKLTAGKNILWESSRMMLPEHKERLIEHRKALYAAERPRPDEDKLERLSQTILQAWRSRTPVRIICLEHGRETPRTGIIRDIDTVQGRIRIQSEGHIRTLRLEEVLDAEPG